MSRVHLSDDLRKKWIKSNRIESKQSGFPTIRIEQLYKLSLAPLFKVFPVASSVSRAAKGRGLGGSDASEV